MHKMHIDVFMRNVRMFANTISVRYWLNFTNTLPDSDRPQVLALEIANIDEMPLEQLSLIETSLLNEGFTIQQRKHIRGINVIIFVVEKDKEHFVKK